MTTTTITKEVKNIKSIELLSFGTSRKDVYVNGKKAANNERKEALIALDGDVKITTTTKTYDADWNLINEDIKVNESNYMKLVREAIKGYRNRKYKY